MQTRYIHILINISIYDHVGFYQVKQEFLLKSPTLIHYRMDHFNLRPLLTCEFSLKYWEMTVNG